MIWNGSVCFLLVFIRKNVQKLLFDHDVLAFQGDGGWGQWTNWTDCTKSCGGGVRSRRRECDSPTPEGEGNYCEGLGTEVITCNTDHCPGMLRDCVECTCVCVGVCFVCRCILKEYSTDVALRCMCVHVCVFSGAMFQSTRHSVQ